MARAHIASTCVQSDSIKGLAQSIAKPAYQRLLIAEPVLRRAVPTLVIAFLATICVGAFVQVTDQTRQKQAAMKREIAALADVLAERIERIGPVHQDRDAVAGKLQLLLPSLVPSWGIASGRQIVIGGDGQRILAEFSGENPVMAPDILLDTVEAAQPAQNVIAELTLPNGHRAMAIQHAIPSLPGRVVIMQQRVEALWRSDTALQVTLSATTGFVVLILGFAFHWQSSRARESDLINDAVRGRIDTALNSGRNRCSPCWGWRAAATCSPSAR